MDLNFNKVVFETSFGLAQQLKPSNAIEIVFSGRSNVGKSSLINSIFNRKNLARVSATPGKTATINFYKLEDKIHFVDLPGYGYAKVSKKESRNWKNLVREYLYSDRNIQLIFQLVDIRHLPTKQDIEMINSFIEFELPFIIILTKSDKLSKSNKEEKLKNIIDKILYSDQIKFITFSSVTKEGVNEIKNIINECL